MLNDGRRIWQCIALVLLSCWVISCDSSAVKQLADSPPVKKITGFADSPEYRDFVKKINRWWKRFRNPEKIEFKAKDTLILNSGGMIQGIITEETPQGVRIEFDGGSVFFTKKEIAEVRKGEALVGEGAEDGIKVQEAAPTETDGPYPRIYLKKGSIAYGTGISKEGDTFYLSQAIDGGGKVTVGFKNDEIEKIRIWPPPSEDEADRVFKDLKRQNLKLFYKKPPYYVVSGVESSDAVLYFNALEGFYNDFLLNFFDLIDTGKPHGPLAVVLFGDYNNFLEYSGLPPGTYIAGYYSFKTKILQLFNFNQMEFISRQVKGAEQFNQQVGKAMKQIEDYSGPNSEGKWAAYDYLEKIEKEVDRRKSRLEGLARRQTIDVIRHEATHQMMARLGFEDDKRYIGAWLSEGFADYMGPDDFGGPNLERLMYMKGEMDAGKTLMPIQYLMTFEAGSGKQSVHKLNADYALLSYAESWAFVYYLMKNYPDAFMKYLIDVKNRDKDFSPEKDIELLEKHLGKKLKDLDKDFEVFTKKLMQEKIDDQEYYYFKFFNPMTLFPAPEKFN